MSEICARAIAKLEKEAESVSGQQVPAIAIYNFLKKKCQNDEIFASKILIETKKLSKCFNYIMEIAYKQAKKIREKTNENRVGVGMSSKEIFELVIDYFNLDDEAIEKKKAEEKAKNEAKRKQIDLVKKEKKTSTKEKTPTKKASDYSNEHQLSMFEECN